MHSAAAAHAGTPQIREAHRAHPTWAAAQQPPPSPPSPPPSPAPPPGGIEVKPSNNILDTATGVDATTAIIIGVVVGLGGGLILIGALTYAYYKYRKGPRFSPKTKTEVHELEVGPR
mmetsp:Transcript_24587/g.61076  ORF Transcript_24587/g.61076 Transcript_24587/m.61076 type:complete len:117 (+) Transcript_24587:2372-2722(+)